MVTIKSYTDISQSKKLAAILPIESADMVWSLNNKNHPPFIEKFCAEYGGMQLPCWSLTALLSVLPKIVNTQTLFIETSAALWHIGYRGVYIARSDNPVDACVDMIIKLKELKML